MPSPSNDQAAAPRAVSPPQSGDETAKRSNPGAGAPNNGKTKVKAKAKTEAKGAAMNPAPDDGETNNEAPSAATAPRAQAQTKRRRADPARIPKAGAGAGNSPPKTTAPEAQGRFAPARAETESESKEPRAAARARRKNKASGELAPEHDATVKADAAPARQPSQAKASAQSAPNNPGDPAETARLPQKPRKTAARRARARNPNEARLRTKAKTTPQGAAKESAAPTEAAPSEPTGGRIAPASTGPACADPGLLDQGADPQAEMADAPDREPEKESRLSPSLLASLRKTLFRKPAARAAYSKIMGVADARKECDGSSGASTGSNRAAAFGSASEEPAGARLAAEEETGSEPKGGLFKVGMRMPCFLAEREETQTSPDFALSGAATSAPSRARGEERGETGGPNPDFFMPTSGNRAPMGIESVENEGADAERAGEAPLERDRPLRAAPPDGRDPGAAAPAPAKSADDPNAAAIRPQDEKIAPFAPSGPAQAGRDQPNPEGEWDGLGEPPDPSGDAARETGDAIGEGGGGEAGAPRQSLSALSGRFQKYASPPPGPNNAGADLKDRIGAGMGERGLPRAAQSKDLGKSRGAKAAWAVAGCLLALFALGAAFPTPGQGAGAKTELIANQYEKTFPDYPLPPAFEPGQEEPAPPDPEPDAEPIAPEGPGPAPAPPVARGAPAESKPDNPQMLIDVGETETRSAMARARLPLTDRSWVLAAGTSIDCVLETRIDSAYPGPVRCLVARDARSANGAQTLVPKGSRILGRVNSVSDRVGAADSGAPALWLRVVTPQGVEADLPGSGAGFGADRHLDPSAWADAAVNAAAETAAALAGDAKDYALGKLDERLGARSQSGISVNIGPGYGGRPTWGGFGSKAKRRIVEPGTMLSVTVGEDVDFSALAAGGAMGY